MSGTGATVAAALTEAQKVEIRRYCGYPAYGAGAAGFDSWRFFQAYGVLEYRMTNLAPDEVAVVLRYVGTLEALERAVPEAAENLDTEAAGPWQHNPKEVRERLQLFDQWRRRLCQFLGLPPGPGFEQAGIPLIV